MFRRNWIFFIVLVGLSLTFSGQAQVQESLPETQEEQSTNAPSDPDSPLSVRIVEDQEEKESRERVERKTRDNQQKDLIAQEGMHVQTQRMADYVVTQTWFIGIGTLLLLATLGLTYMANRAAQKAVSVTREMGEAQVTAYVRPMYLVISRSKDEITAEIPVECYGETAALDVFFDCKVTIKQLHSGKVETFSFESKIVPHIYKAAEKLEVSISLEKEQFTLPSPPRGKARMSAPVASPKHLMVSAIGSIRYSNVFGSKYVSSFDLSREWNGPLEIDNGITLEGDRNPQYFLIESRGKTKNSKEPQH